MKAPVSPQIGPPLLLYRLPYTGPHNAVPATRLRWRIQSASLLDDLMAAVWDGVPDWDIGPGVGPAS